MTVKTAAAVAVPSFGPAVVTVLGQDIPLMATGMSLAGLALVRYIAPPTKRHLTRGQGWALTGVHAIILMSMVMSLQPGPGMAVAWGIGLGISGLLAVEYFGRRVVAMMRAMFEGLSEKMDTDDEKTG